MRIAALIFLGCVSLSAVSPGLAAGLDKSAQNAALIRAHHDALNRGDWKTALTYYAEDTKNFGEPAGREGLGRILEDIWTTFPDFRVEIIDLVAKGDSVVVHCRESGTHLGVGRIPVNGGLLVDVPPTHKHFEVEVVHWYTMRDGKIVDHFGARDDIGMMQQLGLLPPTKPFDWEHMKPINGAARTKPSL